MYKHFGDTVDEDEFVDMFKYTASKPYVFVYIDTDPREESMRFQSGFNEHIALKK